MRTDSRIRKPTRDEVETWAREGCDVQMGGDVTFCDAKPFWVVENIGCVGEAKLCARHLLMLARQAAKLLGYTLVKKEVS